MKRLAEARDIGVDEQWAYFAGFDGYCKSTIHDQHLQTNHLLPYLWVEAYGVNACESGTRVPGPGGRRSVQHLQYFESLGTTGFAGRERQNVRRSILNCDTIVHGVKGWSVRLQGATYVASSEFSKINWYSDVKVLTATPVANTLADSMSMSNTKDTLDARLWKRSHCPVPHSGECSFVGDECGGFAITRRQYTDMSFSIHPTAVVTVTVGHLRRSNVAQAQGHVEMVVNRSRSALCMFGEYWDAPDAPETDIIDIWRLAITNIPQRHIMSATPTMAADNPDVPPAPRIGGPSTDM